MLESSTLTLEYLTLASQCRTQNQLNKLHIGLENLLAPSEFGYFADLARRQELPARSYPWLVRIASLSPGIFDAPQRFGRRALSENILLYQDTSRDAADKSLLVAFCGNGRRLGLPTSVFLQCLDSRGWDVVLVRKDNKYKSYLLGLEGLSSYFPGVIRYVRSATSARQYQRAITFGVSGGGYAAILAAILMKAARGVSICGSPPQSPLGFWSRWQLAVRQACAARGPQFDFVYGADHSYDREAALSLLNSFGGRLHPVADVDDHNALSALLKRGQLADFLNEMLGSGKRSREYLHEHVDERPFGASRQ
jgi:hypothetical protein